MWWVVWHKHYGYLVDTCAGGVWAQDPALALWFESKLAALEAIVAAELDIELDRANSDVAVIPFTRGPNLS